MKKNVALPPPIRNRFQSRVQSPIQLLKRRYISCPKWPWVVVAPHLFHNNTSTNTNNSISSSISNNKLCKPSSKPSNQLLRPRRRGTMLALPLLKHPIFYPWGPGRALILPLITQILTSTSASMLIFLLCSSQMGCYGIIQIQACRVIV